MKNRINPSVSRIAVTTAFLMILVGIFAFSASPKTTYGATVDAASSATTIATPTLSSVVSVGYESLKVTWTSVSNADHYEVYRATSSTGTFSKVTSVSGTSFTNNGRVTGKYYYYKVRAVVMDGSTAYKGSFSGVKGAKAIPSTPTITLSKASSTSVKISWSGVAGATKYQIYRATSSTGTYTHLYSAGSAARSWVNTGRTPGKTYYYKVRAYHLEGTTKVYGKFSSVKSIKM